MEASEQPKSEERPTPPRRGRRADEPTSAAQPAQQSAPKVPDLPVSQLVEGATGLLACSPWVAAGALRDHKPDDKLSIDAAKAEVEKFLKQPVKSGGD